MLLFSLCVMANERQDIGWERNLQALRSNAAAGKFKGCDNKGGLGQSYAFNLLEFAEPWVIISTGQDLQDTICHSQHIMLFSSTSQEYSHQFKVGQCFCAFLLKLFAR